MPHTNSPLITMKCLLIAGSSNVYAVKFNDEVVDLRAVTAERQRVESIERLSMYSANAILHRRCIE